MTVVGVDPRKTWTAVAALEDPPPFALGTRGFDHLENEFIFVSVAAGVSGPGYVCSFNAAFAAAMVSNTDPAAIYRPCGVALVAFPVNARGWLQVKGTANIRAEAAGAAPNAQPITTATPGALLTGTPAAGTDGVNNLVFTVDPTGAGVFAGIVNYPFVGTVT